MHYFHPEPEERRGRTQLQQRREDSVSTRVCVCVFWCEKPTELPATNLSSDRVEGFQLPEDKQENDLQSPCQGITLLGTGLPFVNRRGKEAAGLKQASCLKKIVMLHRRIR